MKTPNIINDLIEKHKQREYNKPRYKIEDLYIGDIVILKDFEFKDIITTRYYFKPVKEYAIFIEKDFHQYTHIKSGQDLYVISSAELGDYAINNIVPMRSVFVRILREHNIKPNSKISRATIDKLEAEFNKKFAPEQTTTKLFN